MLAADKQQEGNSGAVSTPDAGDCSVASLPLSDSVAASAVSQSFNPATSDSSASASASAEPRTKPTPKKRRKLKDAEGNARPATKSKGRKKKQGDREQDRGEGSVWSQLGVLKCDKCGFTTTESPLFRCHVCASKRPVKILPRPSSNTPTGPVHTPLEYVSVATVALVTVTLASTTSRTPTPETVTCRSELETGQPQAAAPEASPPVASIATSVASVGQTVTLPSTTTRTPTPETVTCRSELESGQPQDAAPEASSPVAFIAATSVSSVGQTTVTLPSIASRTPTPEPIACRPELDEASSSQSTVQSELQSTEKQERWGFIGYDESSKKFVCLQCSYTAEEGISLVEHLLYQITEKPYNCRICKEGFASRLVFQAHFAEKHKGEKLECELHQVKKVRLILRLARAKKGQHHGFVLHRQFKACIKPTSAPPKHPQATVSQRETSASADGSASAANHTAGTGINQRNTAQSNSGMDDNIESCGSGFASGQDHPVPSKDPAPPESGVESGGQKSNTGKTLVIPELANTGQRLVEPSSVTEPNVEPECQASVNATVAVSLTSRAPVSSSEVSQTSNASVSNTTVSSCPNQSVNMEGTSMVLPSQISSTAVADNPNVSATPLLPTTLLLPTTPSLPTLSLPITPSLPTTPLVPTTPSLLNTPLVPTTPLLPTAPLLPTTPLLPPSQLFVVASNPAIVGTLYHQPAQPSTRNVNPLYGSHSSYTSSYPHAAGDGMHSNPSSQAAYQTSAAVRSSMLSSGYGGFAASQAPSCTVSSSSLSVCIASQGAVNIPTTTCETVGNSQRPYSPISPARPTCTSSIYTAITPPSSPTSHQVYSPITPPLTHRPAVTSASSLQPVSSTGGSDKSDVNTVCAKKEVSSPSVSSAGVCRQLAPFSHQASDLPRTDCNSASTELSQASSGGSSVTPCSDYFVKFHNSYVCLPCRRRFPHKETFYQHAWDHLHPTGQACHQCSNISEKLCSKTREMVDSVSSSVDRKLISKLTEDCRRRLQPKLDVSAPVVSNDREAESPDLSRDLQAQASCSEDSEAHRSAEAAQSNTAAAADDAQEPTVVSVTPHHDAQDSPSGLQTEPDTDQTDTADANPPNPDLQGDETEDSSCPDLLRNDSNKETDLQTQEKPSEETDAVDSLSDNHPQLELDDTNPPNQVIQDRLPEDGDSCDALNSEADQETDPNLPNPVPEDEQGEDSGSHSGADRAENLHSGNEPEESNDPETDAGGTGEGQNAEALCQDGDADGAVSTETSSLAVDQSTETKEDQSSSVVTPMNKDKEQSRPSGVPCAEGDRTSSVVTPMNKDKEQSRPSGVPCTEGDRTSSSALPVDRCPMFYVCPLCEFSCDRAIDFTIHLNCEHDHNEDYFCFHCNYRGEYTTDLTNHLNAHISGQANIYQCPCVLELWNCSYRTDSLYQMHQHLATHWKCQTFKCSTCSECFTDSGGFLDHVKANSLTLYTCSVCGARFLEKRAFQRHFRTSHSGGQHFRVLKILLCHDRKVNRYDERTAASVKARQSHSDRVQSLPSTSDSAHSLASHSESAHSLASQKDGVLPSVPSHCDAAQPLHFLHAGAVHSHDDGVPSLPSQAGALHSHDDGVPSLPSQAGALHSLHSHDDGVPSLPSQAGAVQSVPSGFDGIQSFQPDSAVAHSVSSSILDAGSVPATTPDSVSASSAEKSASEDPQVAPRRPPVSSVVSVDKESGSASPSSVRELGITPSACEKGEESLYFHENVSSKCHEGTAVAVSQEPNLEQLPECSGMTTDQSSDSDQTKPSVSSASRESGADSENDKAVALTAYDSHGMTAAHLVEDGNDEAVALTTHDSHGMTTAHLAERDNDKAVALTTPDSHEMTDAHLAEGENDQAFAPVTTHDSHGMTTAHLAERDNDEAVALTTPDSHEMTAAHLAEGENDQAFAPVTTHDSHGTTAAHPAESDPREADMNRTEQNRQQPETTREMPSESHCQDAFCPPAGADVREHRQGMMRLTDLFGGEELHRALSDHLCQESADHFFCAICDKRFSRREKTHEHLFTHFHVPLFSCCFCPFESGSKRELKRHMAHRHPDQRIQWNSLKVDRDQLLASLEQERPLTVGKFRDICHNLKRNKFASAVEPVPATETHCGGDATTAGKVDGEESEAATTVMSASRVGKPSVLLESPAASSSTPASSISNKREKCLPAESVVSLPSSEHTLCGVKSFNRSTVTHRRSTTDGAGMGESGDHLAPAATPDTKHIRQLAAKPHSSAHHKQRSAPQNSGLKKSYAKPKAGTYVSVKSGSMIKLKCSFCSKMTLSHVSMAKHLETCHFYINTQPVSNQKIQAGSLALEKEIEMNQEKNRSGKELAIAEISNDSSKNAKKDTKTLGPRSKKLLGPRSKKYKQAETPSELTNAEKSTCGADSFASDKNEVESERPNSVKNDHGSKEGTATQPVEEDNQSDADMTEDEDIVQKPRKRRTVRVLTSSSDEDDWGDQVNSNTELGHQEEEMQEEFEPFSQCKICDFVAPTSHINELKEHLTLKHGHLMSLIKCGYCGQPYGNAVILKRHINSKHPGKPQRQEQLPYQEFFRVQEKENCSPQKRLHQLVNCVRSEPQIKKRRTNRSVSSGSEVEENKPTSVESRNDEKENASAESILNTPPATPKEEQSTTPKKVPDNVITISSSSEEEVAGDQDTEKCKRQPQPTKKFLMLDSEEYQTFISSKRVPDTAASASSGAGDVARVSVDTVRKPDSSVKQSAADSCVTESPVLPSTPETRDSEGDKQGKEDGQDIGQPGSERYRCVKCSQPQPDYSSIVRHLLGHVDYRLLRCDCCSMEFISLRKAQKHYSRKHHGKPLPRTWAPNPRAEKEILGLIKASEVPSASVPTAGQPSAPVEATGKCKRSIQCCACQDVFESLSVFRRHSVVTHGTENSGERTVWQDTLTHAVYDLEGNMVHPLPAFQSTVFKHLCGYCSTRFVNRKAAVLHSRVLHSELDDLWIVKLGFGGAQAAHHHAARVESPASPAPSREEGTPASSRRAGEGSGETARGAEKQIRVRAGARVVMKDFLRGSVEEFDSLLKSNGITQFHPGDRQSPEALAFLMQFAPVKEETPDS